MKRYPRDNNSSSGEIRTIAAPTKGLRTNSALIGLSPEYALALDNLICQPDALVSRLGCEEWATGWTGNQPTLMSYNAGAGDELYLATSEGVWEVTSQGVVGVSLAARTAGRGRSVNIGTSAGHFLYYVNGVDKPLLYDGTDWTAIDGSSTPAITGVTTTSIANVCNYRQRLYFLVVGELGFRYLAADSVGGAATLFRIGSLVEHGGEAMGIISWSIDGGDGQDDMLAVATSEGEVVIFSGPDPGDAATWTPRGRFDLGRPVSRDCFVRFGGDVLYLSEDGVFPLSRALLSTVVNRSKAVSRDIEPTLVQAVRTYGNNDGWQMLVIPRWALILVNIPEANPKQYVYNTLSGGWSRFTGWNARCWHNHGGDTYFVDGTAVKKAFVGRDDDGVPIPWVMRTSYQMLARGLVQSLPLLTKPLIAFQISTAFNVGYARDYKDQYVTQNIPANAGGSVGIWNTGLWNTALWGGGFVLQNVWHTVPADAGMALSLEMSGQLQGSSVAILGASIKFSEASPVT